MECYRFYGSSNGWLTSSHSDIQPGNLLEWEMHWRKGLDCRRQFCEPVGAWFSQLGDLNVVHHMWTYPDLQTRKITREDAWQVDGWAETVTNTGKPSAIDLHMIVWKLTKLTLLFSV